MNLLPAKSLPGLLEAANLTAHVGQRQALGLNAVRLLGAVCAAAGGVFSWSIGRFEFWGFLTVLGFMLALAAEVILLVAQPERDWYTGRAIAESTKTLGWRYAVGGAPFEVTMPNPDAAALLVERLTDVAEQGRGRVAPAGGERIATSDMSALRSADFGTRKRAYIDDRITSQQDWYSNKAAACRQRAFVWRIALVVGETSAIVIASTRALGVLETDVAGIMAALVASGAAWLGLKQYSTLASSYSIAAFELALSKERLEIASESNWAQVVADAEEAISREHTMWLASRSAASR